MKNNVLSAFVVFFAVIAALLIIDDLSYGVNPSGIETEVVDNVLEKSTSQDFATVDLETED